ncbi:ABC transporter ATP-binding protein [Paraliobacillus sp. JSM ZJ581]|uniref:ABC transporter ATP-binding protein n=1 Tax=Paraliobacillus sp. JSM ZJ581 TaxID=3342118 RepID=UPI0035A86C28
MLLVKNIIKEFSNGVRANDNVNLTVNPGEIVGLLGPNGAGKTTLVSQIIGSVKPTSGTITIGDVDVIDKPKKARELCSLQPQSQVSIEGLTPRQAIELAGRIRKGDRKKVALRTNNLLRELNLEKWADKMAKDLSGGIKRLVIFCMTAVVPGRLVIFDEPTNDVDPVRRRLLWNQIRKLAEEGAALLIVTHNVLEAEQSLDRLAIIHEGKVVVSGKSSELKKDLAGNFRLQLVIQPTDPLPDFPDYITVTTRRGSRLLTSVPERFVSDAVQWAEYLRHSEMIEEYTLSPMTLEDAYFKWISPQVIEKKEELKHDAV